MGDIRESTVTGASSPRVVRKDHGVISGEHTAFVVRSDDLAPVAAPWEGNTLVTVVDDGLSQGDILVNTGDQWGPYDVTTLVLDGPPGDADAEWEDIVELSLTAGTRVVVTEMIDSAPAIALVDRPGSYRMRVSARGRVADRDLDDDHDDDPSPIEWYLLEVWPAPRDDPRVVRVQSPYAERQLSPPPALVVPEGEAGLAAAERIGRDVDRRSGARTLSGHVGSVAVERTIRGARRKLFTPCAHLLTWSHKWVGDSNWSFSGTADTEVGGRSWGFSHDHADQLTGRHGSVRTTFLEVERPHRVMRQWDWTVPRDGGPWTFETETPFLPRPTRITITLNQSRDEAGDPWTTIRIEHDQLPEEWLIDMETYWVYQLAIAEHAGFGLSA